MVEQGDIVKVAKEGNAAKPLKKPARPLDIPKATDPDNQAMKKVPEVAPRRNGDLDNNNPGVENLDKVRDILFGSQMRDNERRFGRLEERLAKDTADLRDETRKRLESLEAFIRRELQTIAERFKQEQTQRSEAIQDVARELKEINKAFQQRATELQSMASEIQRELRQEILDQSNTLREEMQNARSEQADELENTASELRSQKVDRSALAVMFTELAARLGDIEE